MRAPKLTFDLLEERVVMLTRIGDMTRTGTEVTD